MAMRTESTALLLALVGFTSNGSAQLRTEVMAKTGSGLGASMDASVSINDLGWVAFTGLDTAGLSRVVFVRTPGTPEFVGFSGTTRNHFNAAINNTTPPSIVTRERVSGSPVHFLIRTWPTDGSAGTIVGATTGTPDFDSAQGWVSLNSSGVAAFPGLINGSTFTTLFAGASRPPDDVATFSSVVPLRPQIADDDSIAFRDNGNRVLLWPAFGTTPTAIATPTLGFSTTGLSPGVSADGDLVAFYGDLTQAGADSLNAHQAGLRYDGETYGPNPPILTAGPGIFASMFTEAGRVIVRVAGLAGNGKQDPGELLLGGVDLGVITAFVPDSRVGVTTVQCDPDRNASVCFLADITTTTGTARALMLSRVGVVPDTTAGGDPRYPIGLRYGAFAPVGWAGQTIPSLPGQIQDVLVYLPINDESDIAWSATYSGGQAVIRSRYDHVFRQLRQDDETWKTTRIVPALPDTIGAVGCTITSLSMVVGYYGYDTTPVQMRDYLTALKKINTSNAQTSVEGFYFNMTAGGCGTRIEPVRPPGPPQNWQSIDAAMRAGQALMLKVPSSTKTAEQIAPAKGGGKGHYVIAYGLTADAPTSGALAPQHVLVADPSRWRGNRYLPTYADRWDESGQRTKLTLADYFSALNSFLAATAEPRRGLVYDALSWYNSGTFTDQSPTARNFTLATADRRKLITSFRVRGARADDLYAAIEVPSPVEIVLIDPVNGQRYASSADIAQAGDVLLDKYTLDLAATSEEENPEQDVDPDVPPYSLLIPVELLGRSVSVQIVGVKNSPYTVSYFTGTDELAVSDPIQGTITPGAIISGEFTITPTVCRADFNGDGFVTGDDFDQFVTFFIAGTLEADFNGDGFVTGDDFDAFVVAFVAGC